MQNLLITGSGDPFKPMFHPKDNERQGRGEKHKLGYIEKMRPVNFLPQVTGFGLWGKFHKLHIKCVGAFRLRKIFAILNHPPAAGKEDHLFTNPINLDILDGIFNTLPFCRLSSLLQARPFKWNGVSALFRLDLDGLCYADKHIKNDYFMHSFSLAWL